jgi:predicted enzyme related to lactoylglutathione lyase
MSLTIFYVESPAASARFYEKLLDRAPIEASPTFAMFTLEGGGMLGLWAREEVKPTALHLGGGGELSLEVADVDATHAAWVERGATILQPPMDLDFGRNFLAVDPDQHRLRVFKPAM